MALPTNGRVIIDTTVGEIDIELWSKVDYVHIPNSSRRIVPGFLVQTGDKTGTGAGGESFYGGMCFADQATHVRTNVNVEPFEDEIHPRLRFAHRGLVGMANNGTRHSNDSQFFITLDRADELHGKHTLFGRVMGDTLFNVLKIGEMGMKKSYKIKTIRILDNPFDNIVPRITAAEKRAQQRAREEAQREREEQERRKGAKKNIKLLSFGAYEGGEEEESVTFQKRAIYRPDLEDIEPSIAQPGFITQPQRQSSQRKNSETASAPKLEMPVRSVVNDRRPEYVTMMATQVAKPATKKDETDITKIRQRHAEEQAASQSARSAEIEKMEADIRRLTKRRDGDDSDEEPIKKKTRKSYLQEELDKYAKGRGLNKKGKKKDESNVLAALTSFRSKLQNAASQMDVDAGDNDPGRDPDHEGGGEAGMEVDDDRGFMTHALHFPKDDGEESRKAERDYEVIDPRQRGARAKEEERVRKRLAKARGGGGGRR
ncbi:hypothetical protein C0989_009622 [Termitomyces sp. Mn162]|nr:hypothetical protein C0989_009622 [Termitomyces sp. Mn162]